MRFIVVGAGAIGGVIGARLFEAGHDVTLVARGKHLEVIRSDGLTVSCPTGTVHIEIPAVAHPVEAGPAPGDVVIIATKSQDTVTVLESVASAGTGGVSIVCAQNGVNNEREALRRFEDVYGVCVMAPASHLEPGAVEASSNPTEAILDVGRYPSGVDDKATEIARAFESAPFVSIARPDIMRWKYRKLVMNLFNALEALLEHPGSSTTQETDGQKSDFTADRRRRRSRWPQELTEGIREEAAAVLAAAGIDVVSEQEDAERRGEILRIDATSTGQRRGGSTWQSLERGLGTIETDFLNGEIVLLGRLHGVPTPVNSMLQSVSAQAAMSRLRPGSFSAGDLLSLLG